MRSTEPGCLLRIYLGEAEMWHGRPLYEAIVLKARELHLGGATVLRGPMGFGAHAHMHTAKVLRLSEDLPIVIEIVDARPKIEAFMPHVDEMMRNGIATMEQVELIRYRGDEEAAD